MAYSLAAERVPLTIEDGPTIEVGPILAWPVYYVAVGRFAKYLAAEGPAQLAALSDLYGFFVAEAQPTWEIVDHRGAIPATSAGMLRLPLDIALKAIEAWIDLFTPKTSAVDEMVPPGVLRDDLNAALKRKRKKG